MGELKVGGGRTITATAYPMADRAVVGEKPGAAGDRRLIGSDRNPAGGCDGKSTDRRPPLEKENGALLAEGVRPTNQARERPAMPAAEVKRQAGRGCPSAEVEGVGVRIDDSKEVPVTLAPVWW